jgi:tetratricopeptide (TPR) repeat protein
MNERRLTLHSRHAIFIHFLGGLMPVLSVIFSCLLLLLLSACQTLSARPEVPAPINLPAEALIYRAFAEGQLRLDDGDYNGAAKLFAEAATAVPGNSVLILAQADALLRAGEEAAALRVVESALLSSPQDVDLLLFLGNFYFGRDEISKSIDYFQRVHDIAPDEEAGAFHLVLAIIKSGDLDRAVALLTGMLERKPEFPVAELMLARIYREKGDFPAAEAILHRIEKREPELDTPYLELGALFESRQDWERAIGYYRTAVNLNPENIAIRHHLARIYIEQNDLSSALAEFGEILFQNPGDLEARRKIGLIHLERKDYSAAIPVFKSLIESAPELDEVRFYLGTAYEGQGELIQALTHFEAVSEHAEIYNDALMHRAFILHKLQRLAEATELLEARLTGVDVSPEIYLYLASLYEMNGRSEQALKTLHKTRERFIDNAELAYRLGLLFERYQQPATALAEMRRALDLDPNHAEALNFLAYYYAEQGENLDEALLLAHRALALKAEAHILDTLGWVYFVRGDFDNAGKFLAQAVEKAGDDPIILEHYGDALRANKANKEAIAIYQRSLAIQPDNAALRDKLKALLPVKEK